MSADPPKSLELLLKYLYTRSASLVRLTSFCSSSPILDVANVAILAHKYDQPGLLDQCRIELARFSDPTYVSALGNIEDRARDLIRGLAQLHRHEAGSRELRELMAMVLGLLRSTQQMKVMDENMMDLIAKEVDEDGDVGLPCLLVKFYAGGDCFADSPSRSSFSFSSASASGPLGCHGKETVISID